MTDALFEKSLFKVQCVAQNWVFLHRRWVFNEGSHHMLSFSNLWANHSNVKREAPLLDKSTYQNQCAINLYAALVRSGVNAKTFRGQLSWQKNKPKYAIRAQELADWLASSFGRSGGVRMPQVQKFSGKDVFEKIKGKRGIIFFQNYYGPGNQGDHIDLWDGSRLTHWASWIQIYARLGSVGFRSDYRGSESVWFWHVP